MSEYLRTAEYLASLDMNACCEYCRIRDIEVDAVVPYSFTSPEEVYQSLVTFKSEGISLHFIFDNADVWSIYLRSIIPERFHSGVLLMLSSGNPGNLIDFFDACYRFGNPAIADGEYDAILRLYLETYPALSYLQEETYDDRNYSTLIMNAVKMCSTRSSTSTKVQRMELTGHVKYDELNTDKTTSIRPVVSASEAFDFWVNSPVCCVHFSLKVDGVNTKIAFSDSGEGLELAISRGRSTNSIDYTEAVKRMLKFKGVDESLLRERVIGESFVNLNDLEVLQKRYPSKDYKSPKSTAMAMLRAPDNFLPEDYKLLSFCGFSYGDVKPDVGFKKMESAGLDVPPYLEFEGEAIPRSSLEAFEVWLQQNVLNPLWEAGTQLGIGSDGVVMHLLADINTERRDKYSDSNIAIKFSHWGAVEYSSTVEEILIEQKRVEASIVLKIAPVVMRDNNTATRVGVGSPDILIRDDVRVGDTIIFERKSEAYNVYLSKKK